MRITGIRTLVCNAEMRNWIFVRVDTDQPGLYGWGEATLEWKTRAVVGAVDDLAPLLVGRDPRQIEQAVQILRKHGFWRLGTIGSTALSGIETALWDILGKSLGVPVWQLLGGRTRDHVRIYTHLGLGDMRAVYETTESAALCERAIAVVERGYSALKVVCVPYMHYLSETRSIDAMARMMADLRDTVGPGIDIMLDCHGRPASQAAAMDVIRAAAPARPLFIEEPVQPDQLELLARITAQSPVAIAAGERLIGRAEFQPLFARNAVHIAQPDICHTGGLWEARKIAAMAETAGIGIAPHNPLGPIAGVAALHFDVATPNVVIQEEMSGAVPWYDAVVDSPIVIRDGAWQVPTRPGLGVEVDEDEVARHPFAQEVLHAQGAVLADGTIVDW